MALNDFGLLAIYMEKFVHPWHKLLKHLANMMMTSNSTSDHEYVQYFTCILTFRGVPLENRILFLLIYSKLCEQGTLKSEFKEEKFCKNML